MDETLTATAAPEDAAQYQQAIAPYFAEMDRLHEIMAFDQIAIEQSQARTWAMLAEIKAALGSSKRLDGENQAHEREKQSLRREIALLRAALCTLTGKEASPLLLEETDLPPLQTRGLSTRRTESRAGYNMYKISPRRRTYDSHPGGDH